MKEQLEKEIAAIDSEIQQIIARVNFLSGCKEAFRKAAFLAEDAEKCQPEQTTKKSDDCCKQ